MVCIMSFYYVIELANFSAIRSLKFRIQLLYCWSTFKYSYNLHRYVIKASFKTLPYRSIFVNFGVERYGNTRYFLFISTCSRSSSIRKPVAKSIYLPPSLPRVVCSCCLYWSLQLSKSKLLLLVKFRALGKKDYRVLS